MNHAAVDRLRSRLAADRPVVGLWITLADASVAEIAVHADLDWIVVDAEHGHLDWGDIVGHLRAVARSNTVALVRVAALDMALIKRSLDLGADGVVIPVVETAEQLAAAQRFSRYPPQGRRGIGGERATAWGTEIASYVPSANDNVLVVPLIESSTAAANMPALLDVAGGELFFFGPADFSSSAGFPGQWEGPGVAERLLRLKDEIRARGKHCGIMATGVDDLRRRQDQGFRMIGLSSDTGLILAGIRQRLAALGPVSDGGQVSGNSQPVESSAPVLARPPEKFRPDRDEQMIRLEDAETIEIAPRAVFRCQVGQHNQARRLTTGFVELAPGAEIPYHDHPFAESLTLLSGMAVVEVEGRIYKLGALDNITIPSGLAHTAYNRQGTEPAVLHIAMSTDRPTRRMVEQFFSRRSMTADSIGVAGAEHVVRMASASSYAAGPGTQFVDYCNAQLIPGIAMSGGYARFAKGGRLPAHVHDFDESISIIEGDATCIVEGRNYRLSDCATALQPRGRVHYFINQQSAPMAMIWFYAGPLPERIVVDERCATVEGNPWKAPAAVR